MSVGPLRLARLLIGMLVSGRATRRSVAAAFKLSGRRLERRWPFVVRSDRNALNFDFDDLLEFQRARTDDFTALIVGAYDGVANDPASHFIRAHNCKAVFVEPQPLPFERLRRTMRDTPKVTLINAAVDQVSGQRDFYTVRASGHQLPSWTEQLGSFDRDHLLRHERRAPGISEHIIAIRVQTLTFGEVLETCSLTRLDLLQIDAEGMDGRLLRWFPFDKLMPSVIYFENAHMSREEHLEIRNRLQAAGYVFCERAESCDDMAVLV